MLKNLIRFIIALTLVFIPSIVLAQATVNDSVAWDYSSANLTTYSVTHFNVCFDTNQLCTQVLATSGSFVDVDTQANHVSFARLIPAITPGAHNFTVAACNVGSCSEISSFNFTFDAQPISATGLRLRRSLP